MELSELRQKHEESLISYYTRTLNLMQKSPAGSRQRKCTGCSRVDHLCEADMLPLPAKQDIFSAAATAQDVRPAFLTWEGMLATTGD